MRTAAGVMATLLAGAAIVWAGVQVEGELARGEGLNPLPFVVAGVALLVIVLVALLSDSVVRGPRRRRKAQAPTKYGYIKRDGR